MSMPSTSTTDCFCHRVPLLWIQWFHRRAKAPRRLRTPVLGPAPEVPVPWYWSSRRSGFPHKRCQLECPLSARPVRENPRRPAAHRRNMFGSQAVGMDEELHQNASDGERTSRFVSFPSGAVRSQAGGVQMAKFSCCGQDFATEEALAKHQVEVHKQQKKTVGSCCGLDFHTQAGLKEHMRTAHGR